METGGNCRANNNATTTPLHKMGQASSLRMKVLGETALQWLTRVGDVKAATYANLVRNVQTRDGSEELPVT